jgi:hypothetical protein
VKIKDNRTPAQIQASQNQGQPKIKTQASEKDLWFGRS